MIADVYNLIGMEYLFMDNLISQEILLNALKKI
jgi:hypothetical protein